MKKEYVVIVDDKKEKVVDFWFKKVFLSNSSKDGKVSLGRIS